MASLYIRDLDAHLVLALRRKALDEGKTLKQLVIPMLELLVNSKPVEEITALDFDLPWRMGGGRKKP